MLQERSQAGQSRDSKGIAWGHWAAGNHVPTIGSCVLQAGPKCPTVPCHPLGGGPVPLKSYPPSLLSLFSLCSHVLTLYRLFPRPSSHPQLPPAHVPPTHSILYTVTTASAPALITGMSTNAWHHPRGRENTASHARAVDADVVEALRGVLVAFGVRGEQHQR